MPSVHETIDEPPLQRHRRVDAPSAQSEGRRALSSDPTGHAHGSPGTRDQTQLDLRKTDLGCPVRHNCARKRSDLDSSAECVAVDLHLNSLGEEVHETSWRTRQPSDVSCRWVWAPTEFVEVAAGAERWTGAGEHHVTNRRIGHGDRQRTCQLVAHLG